MKRPVKMGYASLRALAIFVVLGAVAHASMPYLPRIGPPPLRFQVTKSPAAMAVKFDANPVLAATNQPDAHRASLAQAIAAVTAPANTNTPDLALPIVAVPAAPQSPVQSLGDAFSSSILTLPTPDLLGITPQMLAMYFHPVQLGTNSAALVGPFHVSFTPPLPPDESSHAEYIVK